MQSGIATVFEISSQWLAAVWWRCHHDDGADGLVGTLLEGNEDMGSASQVKPGIRVAALSPNVHLREPSLNVDDVPTIQI